MVGFPGQIGRPGWGRDEEESRREGQKAIIEKENQPQSQTEVISTTGGIIICVTGLIFFLAFLLMPSLVGNPMHPTGRMLISAANGQIYSVGCTWFIGIVLSFIMAGTPYIRHVVSKLAQ